MEWQDEDFVGDDENDLLSSPTNTILPEDSLSRRGSFARWKQRRQSRSITDSNSYRNKRELRKTKSLGSETTSQASLATNGIFKEAKVETCSQEVSDAEFDTDLDEYTLEEDGLTIRKRKQARLTSLDNKVRYLEMCESVKATPSSRFLQQINQKTVKMSHHILGPVGAKALALEMVWNRTISDMDLTDTCLGDNGARLIVDMLRDNKNLQRLGLAKNNVGAKTMKALSEVMEVNKTLHSLDLSLNSLNDKNTTPFFIALKGNASLKELKMSYNDISEVAGFRLGGSLAVNKGLEVLKLQWNGLRSKAGVAIGQSLRKNTTLRVLDLSNNGLDDTVARSLGESLRVNSTLVELDFSNNRLSGLAFASIARALERNTSLRVLRCGNNPVALSNEASNPSSIARALRANTCSGVIELHLDEIYLSSETKRALDQLAKDRPPLKIYSGHQKLDTRIAQMLSVKKDKPWRKLIEYKAKRKMSAAELFRVLGSEDGMSVDTARLREKTRGLGLLQDPQIELLVQMLDREGEGEIDFFQFVKAVNT
ncbi:leucine-rich repeat-containing protein 74B [Nematostella vectensis]|uniref:leucine-rich repeat-containing protein 74B n=1 Tax=Nematostella vectensis TaxID=45351 RepID=UPI0020773CF0|nr:leucine-rich repeat-containing protein 74B [Nematostella vectensis]